MPVKKEKWAPAVRVPVMYSLVEDDPFFEATQEEVDRCVKAFANSIRVEGSLIRGAPHCGAELLGARMVCSVFWLRTGVRC